MTAREAPRRAAHLQRGREHRDRPRSGPRSTRPTADVLVVDDGSPDGTADLAEKWGAEHGAVDVLRRTEKSGLGSAYRAGFTWGLEHGFEILIEMDSDLQHDPAMLPALIHAVEDGADLAIGSRYVPGGAGARAGSGRGGSSPRAATSTPPWCSACTCATSPPGFRAYAASATRADRARHGQGRRLRLPDRDGLRGGQQRRAHRRGADHVRQARSGARRRCRRSSCSRPSAWSPGGASATGSCTATRPARPAAGPLAG